MIMKLLTNIKTKKQSRSSLNMLLVYSLLFCFWNIHVVHPFTPISNSQMIHPSSTSYLTLHESQFPHSSNRETPQGTDKLLLSNLQVAIIGAGASGLAAARVLTRNGISSVKILEQQPLSRISGLGGVWRYTPPSSSLSSPSSLSSQRHQPMYESLRSNIPREVMRFREKPWGSNGKGKSFVTHKEVLSYLEDYASEFDLHSYIHYGCQVTQLTVEDEEISLASPRIYSNHNDNHNDDNNNHNDNWHKITLQWEQNDPPSNTSRNLQTETFDVVFICNGHYSIPSTPSIPGMDQFQGTILHSVDYDDATQYTNQTVLCIGGRASGLDIARDISHVAKQVYLSDTAFPKDRQGVPIENGKVIWVPKTERLETVIGSTTTTTTQRVIFGDECVCMPEDIDVIMFCSGYDYHFPFINEDSKLELSAVKGEGRVGPLYKQLWHAEHPSVAFLGLPHSVVPFPLFEIQAEAVVSQLTGNAKTKLPCRETRRASAKTDFGGGGVTKGRRKDTHYLGKAQWEYYTMMSKMSDCYDDTMENFIATSKAIFEHSEIERKGDFPGSADLYRETCYIRDDDNQSFRVTESRISPSEKNILSNAGYSKNSS